MNRLIWSVIDGILTCQNRSLAGQRRLIFGKRRAPGTELATAGATDDSCPLTPCPGRAR